MTLTGVFRTLMVCLLVLVFIFMVSSAYRQNQLDTELVTLSDATSSIATHLSLEELAYTDGAGEKHPYVLDPAKLVSIDNFERKVGGKNFEFNLFLDDFKENKSVGENLPEGKAGAVLVLPCSIYENTRYMPGKMRVTVWYA